eukprot:901653-Rhodomonas_salina.2
MASWATAIRKCHAIRMRREKGMRYVQHAQLHGLVPAANRDIEQHTIYLTLSEAFLDTIDNSVSMIVRGVLQSTADCSTELYKQLLAWFNQGGAVMETILEDKHNMLCAVFNGDWENYFTVIMKKRAALDAIGVQLSERDTCQKILNALQKLRIAQWASFGLDIVRKDVQPTLPQLLLLGKKESQRIQGMESLQKAAAHQAEESANVATKCQYPTCYGKHENPVKCPKLEADLKINSEANMNKCSRDGKEPGGAKLGRP